jgi:hypothetical protein
MSTPARKDLPREIVEPHAQSLEKFANVLASSRLDSKNSDHFMKIINAAVNYYRVAPEDIATQFNVSRGTISRWTSGKSLPHVMMRTVITEWLKKYVLDKANEIKAQY